MDRMDVMEMIMHEQNRLVDISVNDLVGLLADRIAAVSAKLTEEEVYRLISVAAALYQCGHREYSSRGLLGS